jgi:hypothetical protein
MTDDADDDQRTITGCEAIHIGSEKIYYIKFLLFSGRVF